MAAAGVSVSTVEQYYIVLGEYQTPPPPIVLEILALIFGNLVKFHCETAHSGLFFVARHFFFFYFTAVPCYLLDFSSILFIHHSILIGFKCRESRPFLAVIRLFVIVHNDPLCSCDVSWSTSSLLLFELCSFF